MSVIATEYSRSLPVRRPDWPERLLAYLAEREAMPFAWWINDCCTFARGAVLAMTGADLMADVTPYRTPEEAGRILRAPLEEFLDQRLTRVPIGLAQRGDVALVKSLDRDRPRMALTIVEGPTLVGPGAARLPRTAARLAWAV